MLQPFHFVPALADKTNQMESFCRLRFSSPVALTLLICATKQAVGQTAVPDTELPNRWWVSGEIDIIGQHQPYFRALYSGPNSLPPEKAWSSSRQLTLFAGLRLTRSTEVLVSVESAVEAGVSRTSDIAGITNPDAARSPSLGSKPYLARYMIRQVIGLGSARTEQNPGPMGLSSDLPQRRLEFRFGKLSTADFFDLNAIGSESRLQFLNWTTDNNGAYDYAADTRGYTFGALAEYYDRAWTLRFMEGLMPTVANGLILDWSIPRSRSENIELEIRGASLLARSPTLRLLGYANHAKMGSYRDAIGNLSASPGSKPDVASTAKRAALKYGFGINLEQHVTSWLDAYGRWGWNEGRHESFTCAEANGSISAGVRLMGEKWHRRRDAIGVTVVSNSLSGDHRRYLQLGGNGFLLGDGDLNYGREQITAMYYRYYWGRGISISPDIQRIVHPGYNRDRGPVFVASLRVHVNIDRTTLGFR